MSSSSLSILQTWIWIWILECRSICGGLQPQPRHKASHLILHVGLRHDVDASHQREQDGLLGGVQGHVRRRAPSVPRPECTRIPANGHDVCARAMVWMDGDRGWEERAGGTYGMCQSRGREDCPSTGIWEGGGQGAGCTICLHLAKGLHPSPHTQVRTFPSHWSRCPPPPPPEFKHRFGGLRHSACSMRPLPHDPHKGGLREGGMRCVDVAGDVGICQDVCKLKCGLLLASAFRGARSCRMSTRKQTQVFPRPP